MSKPIDVNLNASEQESMIRAYITKNMSEVTLEHYILVLNMTDSDAEAAKAAILNEMVNEIIELKIEKSG